MTFNALALPSLADVPARYVVQSEEAFTRPLALSLLDSNLIEAADIARRPRSEVTLCIKVLTRHWHEITRDLTIFDWQLKIGQDQYNAGRSWHGDVGTNPEKAWALIGTPRGPVSCGAICIGGAMEYLESLQRGVGQTILSALYDVLGMLPRVCTTADTIGIGQYTYWQGMCSEKEAVEELMAVYDCPSKEDLCENYDFFTQKEMFGPMPPWAARPKRRLPRRLIDKIAASDRFAKDVVDAMDEMWTVLTFCGPFPDLSSQDTYAELLDFTLIVRWTDDDSTGRIIDDYLHYASEGDYVEAASVTGFDLADDSISRWLQGIRATAKLAHAAERVLGLLGSSEYEEQRCLVRVLA